MASGERDSTDDWVLPAGSRPATLAHLEQRVDHALAVARASEAAALEIGAAALDAAEQARRAAELAERASAAPRAGLPAVDVSADYASPPGNVDGEAEADDAGGFDSFRHFTERADHVMARLRALERVPLADPLQS
jgi:hypothetical protein